MLGIIGPRPITCFQAGAERFYDKKRLIFGDTTPTHGWLLDNNGWASNTLTLAVVTGSSTITVNALGAGVATISAVIAGTAPIIKAGSGTLTLTGSNTYAGTTTINAGTLVVSGTLGGTSGITVTTGTLRLTGSNDRINNSATMDLAGGTLQLNDVSEGLPGRAGLGC